MQMIAKRKVATPVNWKHGDEVIIASSVSGDPDGRKSPRPNLRIGAATRDNNPSRDPLATDASPNSHYCRR